MTAARGRGGAAAGEIIGAQTLVGLGVEERLGAGLLRLTQWERRDPAIVCGITTAARGDYVVGGARPTPVARRYGTLAGDLGFGQVSVPTQVHGTIVREVTARAGIRGAARPAESPRSRAAPSRSRAESPATRVVRAGRIDGQVTSLRGHLLAATAADCVPVSLWNPATGRIGLVHAGWRGTAAGILGRALRRLREPAGEAGAEVRVHLGPAICGRCYEVDTPVLRAFGLAGERANLDLRGMLAGQAIAAGVRRDAISTSRHCTACGSAGLHSHRTSGGAAGRMAAFLGVRGH